GRGEAPPAHTHRSTSGLQIFQHFLRVSLSFHVFKYVPDTAIRPNYECGSRDPLHFLSVHVLLFDHAESLADFLIGVGQQGIGEIVLILKLFLKLRRIGRDPQDHCPGLLQLLVCVAEPARFNGSTRSIGLGKEKQHHRLAAKILERHVLTVLVRQSKLRGLSLICMADAPSDRSTLYRKLRRIVTVASVALAVTQLSPGQASRRGTVDKGPRALALIELAANGKAHLIPITIMYDGRFYDAGAYKAALVPMALETGTDHDEVQNVVARGL